LDIAFIIELVIFIVLLGFSGFFSSTETSLFSLNKTQVEKMRADGNRRVDLIERLLSEPRRLIVTILIGNEFVNVAASVISAAMVIQLFGADNKFVNLFVMVPLLLVFGEITPKVLAIRNNVAFATFESGPIDQFARMITPLRWAIRIVSEFFTTLIVGKERSKGNIVTEDMVRTLAHVAVGEGTLDHAEAQYIDQIFDFGSQRVNDLMTPRADVTFVPMEATGGEILATFRDSRQSRMPVYDDNRDNIVGILHARDLLAVDINNLGPDWHQREGLLRPPFFVPESKSASDLFATFRQRKKSFALVVDEYGGVTGVITMADLLGPSSATFPRPRTRRTMTGSTNSRTTASPCPAPPPSRTSTPVSMPISRSRISAPSAAWCFITSGNCPRRAPASRSGLSASPPSASRPTASWRFWWSCSPGPNRMPWRPGLSPRPPPEAGSESVAPDEPARP
jgi:putative hemolysin